MRHAFFCQVVAVSVDSTYAHLAFLNTPRDKGGPGALAFSLVADSTKEMARKFGVLAEAGELAGYSHRSAPFYWLASCLLSHA